MNKTIDIYSLLKDTKLDEVFAHALSKKLNIDENKIKNDFNDILNKKLNIIGEQLSKENSNESDINSFKDLSLDEFLNNNTLIQDK